MNHRNLTTPWEKLAQQQVRLAELGVNEEYIHLLVNEFYNKIRKDPEIGRVFNNVIQDNWDEHLIRMRDFWSSLILNAKRYRGNPMDMHRKIEDLEPKHFPIWLSYFNETLQETTDEVEIHEYFMTRAERIANNFQLSIFGLGGESI